MPAIHNAVRSCTWCRAPQQDQAQADSTSELPGTQPKLDVEPLHIASWEDQILWSDDDSSSTQQTIVEEAPQLKTLGPVDKTGMWWCTSDGQLQAMCASAATADRQSSGAMHDHNSKVVLLTSVLIKY